MHSNECLIDIASEPSNTNALPALPILPVTSMRPKADAVPAFEPPKIEALPSVCDTESVAESTTSLIGTKKCLYCGQEWKICKGKRVCKAYKKDRRLKRIQIDKKRRICIQKDDVSRVVRMRLGVPQCTCVEEAEKALLTVSQL